MTQHNRAPGERALIPPALVDQATQLAHAAGVNVREFALALLERAEGGMSMAVMRRVRQVLETPVTPLAIGVSASDLKPYNWSLEQTLVPGRLSACYDTDSFCRKELVPRLLRHIQTHDGALPAEDWDEVIRVAKRLSGVSLYDYRDLLSDEVIYSACLLRALLEQPALLKGQRVAEVVEALCEARCPHLTRYLFEGHTYSADKRFDLSVVGGVERIASSDRVRQTQDNAIASSYLMDTLGALVARLSVDVQSRWATLPARAALLRSSLSSSNSLVQTRTRSAGSSEERVVSDVEVVSSIRGDFEVEYLERQGLERRNGGWTLARHK